MQKPLNPAGVTLFATRRPDWSLPDVDTIHSDLQLTMPEGMQEQAGKRQPCPKCNRNRALYCYDCRLALVDAPKLQLPFKFSIVTHQAESASKNTGVQASILAPDHVELHDIDRCPSFDPSRTVVLFPSDDSVTVDQLEPGSVDRVIIIDSKWRKARELVAEPVLSGVRRVRLTHTRSAFWRFHTAEVSDEGVCTVEAMLHFLRAMVLHDKLAPHQLPPPATSAEPVADGGGGAAAGAAPPLQGDPAPAHGTEAAPEPVQGTQGGPAPVQGSQGDVVAVQGTGDNPVAVQGAPGDAGPVQGGPAPVAVQGAQGDAVPVQGDPAPARPPGYYAYDNLMFFFCLQHKHISAVAAARLEAKVRQQEQGLEPHQNKKKQKKGHQNSDAGAT